jgi:predicted P-loop ATPase
MVAVGPGNIGKSSMPRVLLNDPVGEGRVIDHERGMKEADILGAIRKSSIYNFDEISHVTGRLVDREWAKQLLSQVEDTYRAPYARHVNTGPRRCVFYGTSNDTSFLDSDPTGNRRWWPVSFVQVQFEKLAKDSEQLLAEAVYEWENGYQVNVLPEGFHEIVEEFAMEMEEGAVKVLDFMDKSTLRVKIQGATYRYAFLAEAMLSAGYSMGEINHNGWAVKRLVALLKKHGWGKHHVKAGGNQRKAWIKRT